MPYMSASVLQKSYGGRGHKSESKWSAIKKSGACNEQLGARLAIRRPELLPDELAVTVSYHHTLAHSTDRPHTASLAPGQ